jgi:hypothetical protein
MIPEPRIIEWGGHGPLHVDHIVVAQRIELVGRYVGPDLRRNEAGRKRKWAEGRAFPEQARNNRVRVENEPHAAPSG